MPTAMSPYGSESGGAQADEVVWPSTQASRSSVHDFHAKKPQKRNEATSQARRRTQFARGGRNPARASIPTCPRKDCT